MKEEKVMTLLRQNAVVTLHRRDEVHKMFLNPGAFLESHVAAYTRDGWSVFSVWLCTKEEYLNARLDDVVDSINDAGQERDRLHQQFLKGEIDVEAYTTALTVCHECTMSDMRRLYKLMQRIQREDYDVKNEEAVHLYNMVF